MFIIRKLLSWVFIGKVEQQDCLLRLNMLALHSFLLFCALKRFLVAVKHVGSWEQLDESIGCEVGQAQENFKALTLAYATQRYVYYQKRDFDQICDQKDQKLFKKIVALLGDVLNFL